MLNLFFHTVLISAYFPVDAATTITYTTFSQSMNGWMIILIFLHKNEILREMREEKKKKLLLKIRFNVKINNLMNCMNYIQFFLALLPTIGLLQLYTFFCFFFGVWREIKQNFYVFSFRFQSFSSLFFFVPCNLDFKIVLENGW